MGRNTNGTTGIYRGRMTTSKKTQPCTGVGSKKKKNTIVPGTWQIEENRKNKNIIIGLSTPRLSLPKDTRGSGH